MDDIWSIIIAYCNTGSNYKNVCLVSKWWRQLAMQQFPRAQFTLCNIVLTLAKYYHHDELYEINKTAGVKYEIFVGKAGRIFTGEMPWSKMMPKELDNWEDIAHDMDMYWVINVQYLGEFSPKYWVRIFALPT